MNAEQLAMKFHDTYERLAPSFGYETRKESAKPWSEVPENNRNLMIAVCAEILKALITPLPSSPLGGSGVDKALVIGLNDLSAWLSKWE